MPHDGPPHTGHAPAPVPSLSLRPTPRLLPAALLAVTLVAAAGVHGTAPVLPYDDAFITYRYVDNLFRGHGLVYNEGERVFGATSPLHVLALAAGKAVFRSVAVPALAVRLNLLAYVACGLAVWLALRRFTGRPWFAALGAATLLADPSLLAWSLGGMEAHAFTALLLFAGLAALRGRPVLAGVLTGLTILARPEGALLLPLGGFLLRRSRADLARFAVAVAATVVPWVAFAQLYYGSPVPLSIVAKSRPLYPLPAGYSVRMLLALLDRWVTGTSGDPARSLAILLPLWIAPAAACLRSPLRERGAWVPAALLGGLVTLYGAGNPLIFEWYLPPLCVLGGLSLWAALPAAAAAAFRRARSARPATGALATAGALLAAGVLLRWLTLGGPVETIREDPARRRIEAYRQAAEILNRIPGDAPVVAAPEVGSLGFHFRGRVLDACGLVTPEAHPFLPVPPDEREGPTAGAISADFVRATDPDFVVTLPHFASRSLGTSSWFRSAYEPIARIPLPLPCWGSREVLVFGRSGAG